ncbi:transcriptional and immune response regulator-like [Hemiscyllium ocellatum]|uniref:transcriptional and immune response regulator-like n=1 Tax=Hemiscyllium ocellatum TaxID=170820 RepID=UPI002966073B|nr:transcriptional and immune response regulator-like [Hemiscyllium ocellatum]
MAISLDSEYCYSHRVSPLVYGQLFDSERRKRAAPNIFESVNQAALQRLFERAGDRKAEERARIISTNQGSEEITRALIALRLRKRMKLLQLFHLGRKRLQILSGPR